MIELIVNPIAGNGRSKETRERVQRELDARGIPHHLSETTAPGHATALTKAAIDGGCAAVAVLGGDGLLSEVCAALRGTGVKLVFVPCGTGNDFAKTLRLPKDPVQALLFQLDNPGRLIDCGMVNEHTFLNVAGTGFDIEVLLQTERRKGGSFPYLVGLITGLKHFKTFEAEITIDGVPERGRYTIVSVANGQYMGGGMHVAPLADPADGLFDVMLIEALPKWKFYLLVPFFPPGLHRHLRCTRRVQAREVLVRSGNGFMVQIDGELKRVQEARFALQPGAIQVGC